MYVYLYGIIYLYIFFNVQLVGRTKGTFNIYPEIHILGMYIYVVNISKKRN